MTQDAAAHGFAAFRELVYDDFNLRTWLLVPIPRDAYVKRVVALGAEKGFSFEESDVRAALRDGETTWLMQANEPEV